MTISRSSPSLELFVRPEPQIFRRGEEPELERLLEEAERQTRLVFLQGPGDLRLDEQGRTAAGLRLSRGCFEQVCRLLGPGLSRLLPELSGMASRCEARLCDGQAARRLYNHLLELRFSRLERRRLIVNRQEGLLEGLVGAKHQVLENGAFWRAVREVAARRVDAQFHGAAVLGRRMLLWLRCVDPLFALEARGEPWRLHHGWYFCNAEAAGVSLRAASAAFTRHGVALAPFSQSGGRVNHSGKDFDRRMGRLLETALRGEPDAAALQRGAERMFREPLGLGLADEKARKSRERRLLSRLSDHGVTIGLGRAILEAALHTGASRAAEAPRLYELQRLAASRTQLDLFASLVRAARRLDVNRREKLERAAYALLTERLPL